MARFIVENEVIYLGELLLSDWIPAVTFAAITLRTLNVIFYSRN